MMEKLSQIAKTNKFNWQLRMNIRNCWLAESAQKITDEARNKLAQNKNFEADCLLELALQKMAEDAARLKSLGQNPL